MTWTPQHPDLAAAHRAMTGATEAFRHACFAIAYTVAEIGATPTPADLEQYRTTKAANDAAEEAWFAELERDNERRRTARPGHVPGCTTTDDHHRGPCPLTVGTS